MARPRARELTERELEVMQGFWTRGESTVQEIRDAMAEGGRELAYTTVATLVRILVEKGFLDQTTSERPFKFSPKRSFEEVSGSMLGDLIQRVFGGSRKQLLVQLLGDGDLTPEERQLLEDVAKEESE